MESSYCIQSVRYVTVSQSYSVVFCTVPYCSDLSFTVLYRLVLSCLCQFSQAWMRWEHEYEYSQNKPRNLIQAIFSMESNLKNLTPSYTIRGGGVLHLKYWKYSSMPVQISIRVMFPTADGTRAKLVKTRLYPSLHISSLLLTIVISQTRLD